jgi:hypothetical protein
MMPKIGVGGTGNIDAIQMDEQASNPSTPASGKSAIFLKSDGLYVIDDAGKVTGPLVASASGGGYTEGARVYHDANQSIAPNTATALAFNSERYDTDGIHDPSTNNSRLTCKTAGKYLIMGNIQWAASASETERTARIRLNGSAYIAVVGQIQRGTYSLCQVVSTIYDLDLDDYVELVVRQGTNGSIDVECPPGHEYSPEFMMQRIG